MILAGTELPLLLPTASIAGVEALDSTEGHVDAVMGHLRGTAPEEPAG